MKFLMILQMFIKFYKPTKKPVGKEIQVVFCETPVCRFSEYQVDELTTDTETGTIYVNTGEKVV